MLQSSQFWIKIIEANLEDLMDLRSTRMEETSEEKIYIQVLYHSFKNETAQLKEIARQQGTENHPEAFKNLIHLRSAYKSMQLPDEAALNYLNQLTNDLPLYKAESLFVLALAFQRNKNFALAQKCFEQAAHQYTNLGAEKKSLRSWANAVAAQSCLHPESFLIPEYKSLNEKAFALEEWPTCVGALINLSRELQRVGAMAMAYNKITQAEKISEKFMYFSREHHLVLLQKAHLISCLGHVTELNDLINLLLNSPYIDVKESAEVLNAKLKNEDVKPGAHTLPTWMERSESKTEFESKSESDSLESVLLELLSGGDKTKEELITGLYGDKIDFLSLENRFKNLLYRVRQKFPGRILTRAGKYELVDLKITRKIKA